MSDIGCLNERNDKETMTHLATKTKNFCVSLPQLRSCESLVQFFFLALFFSVYLSLISVHFSP